MWPKWYRPNPYITPKASVYISRIRDVAMQEFEVSMSELKSRCRHTRIVICRHAIAYIIKKKLPETSLSRIAKCVGSREHTTVLNGLKRAKERINDPKDDFADRVSRVIIRL